MKIILSQCNPLSKWNISYKNLMKYSITLICAFVVTTIINSCKKESASTAQSINGKWELRQISGNFRIDYPIGNGSTLEFTDSLYSTSDSAYKIFADGNQPKQGYYKIVMDTSVRTATGLLYPPHQFEDRIILNNDTASDKIFYQLNGDKLIIVSGYFPLDGGVEMTYEKQ